MTLTEQLKKGKLPIGRYYIKDINDEIYISYYINNGFILGFENFSDDEIKEVLAPVPSYEELEELKIDNHNLKAWIKNFQPKYKEMEKENQQLKTQIAKLTEIVGVLPSNHSVGNLGYKIKNQRHEINNRLKEIDKLKELLKECGRRVRLYKETRSSRSYILYDLEALISEIDNAIGGK